MTTATTEISTNSLDAGIEALSRASKTFRLTRFEIIAYRLLMISTDGVITSVALMAVLSPLFLHYEHKSNSKGDMFNLGLLTYAFAFSVMVFVLALISGIFAMLSNIRLIKRMFVESRTFNSLGVGGLSRSLWKESQHKKLIARVRRVVILIISAFMFIAAIAILSVFFVGGAHEREDFIVGGSIGLFYLFIGLFLMSAKYIRFQRERIELASSATTLKQALEGLKKRAGQVEIVSVPVSVLEQATRIESATIAKERDAAVLESVASRHSGYTIRFSREAAAQRAQLDTAERIELEDMVAELSTEGTQHQKRGTAPISGDGRLEVLGKRLSVTCQPDESARAILIVELHRKEAGLQESYV